MKDFDWLISPVSKHLFFEEYFEKKPLVIKRQSIDYFENLISLDDIDNILNSNPMNVKMVYFDREILNSEYYNLQKSENVEVKTSLKLNNLKKLFNEQLATIIIEQLIDSWKPFSILSEIIKENMNCKSNMNLYITPNKSQGFNAHYDTHDVFILQTSGKKHWKIYENPVFLPLGPQYGVPFDNLKLLHEFDLEQGDLIYIPRGFVHEATTGETISVHITLGVYNTTWTKTIIDFVNQISNDFPKLREGALINYIKTTSEQNEDIELIKKSFSYEFNIQNIQNMSLKGKKNVYKQTLIDVIGK